MITYEYFIIIFRFFKGNKQASTVLGYRPYSYTADKQQCNAYQHGLNPILHAHVFHNRLRIYFSLITIFSSFLFYLFYTVY